MQLQQRIDAFVQLGLRLNSTFDQVLNEDFGIGKIIYSAECKNPWFTLESVKKAFLGLSHMLQKKDIELWIQTYPFLQQKTTPKTIAVIMAGNIPMVGFHDAMTVLLSGNKLIAKLSSKDDVLMTWILNQLCDIEPNFNDYIIFERDVLKHFDAVIATGSDNSARYFDFYFKKYPSIVRKNRVSVAVLTGQETKAEIDGLSEDIFSYFGLGCRSVSKLFVPESFDMVHFISQLDPNNPIQFHNKFFNNYEYNKSIYLLNQDKHFDNGFFLLKEDENLFSPIAVVFYEKYKEIRNLDDWFERNKHNLQCVVSHSDQLKCNTISYGQSQMPNIWDYADNVDTMSFLETLI